MSEAVKSRITLSSVIRRGTDIFAVGLSSSIAAIVPTSEDVYVIEVASFAEVADELCELRARRDAPSWRRRCVGAVSPCGGEVQVLRDGAFGRALCDEVDDREFGVGRQPLETHCRRVYCASGGAVENDDLDMPRRGHADEVVLIHLKYLRPSPVGHCVLHALFLTD
jgi:hypothetical protein